jgi:tetratricopeptide (TPR) repeat protein
MVFLQDYWVTPLKAKVQFARWDELLATPAPPVDLEYPTALWHFAQGMARASKGETQLAQQHLEQLAKAAADPKFEQMFIGPQHPFSAPLRISEKVLAGTLARSVKDYPAAIKALEEGVALEDAVPYYEPPLWHQPVRHQLGAVLLTAGKFAAAEAVYKEDLKRNPDNGYALFGLRQALIAQNRKGDAKKVGERFERAWAQADIKLDASSL